MTAADYIKAGAECVTRDGRKSAIYAVDERLHEEMKIVGAIFYGNGQTHVTTWTLSGMFFSYGESNSDLIGPWVEPVTMDWAALPKWAYSIAMRPNGMWHWFTHVPNQCADGWMTSAGICGPIPDPYSPKWCGDWRKSLTQVPERTAQH